MYNVMIWYMYKYITFIIRKKIYIVKITVYGMYSNFRLR